jgi:hypothetical protein
LKDEQKNLYFLVCSFVLFALVALFNFSSYLFSRSHSSTMLESEELLADLELPLCSL